MWVEWGPGGMGTDLFIRLKKGQIYFQRINLFPFFPDKHQPDGTEYFDGQLLEAVQRAQSTD
jgi:hypothetical protein